mmetsp:Transcript_22136/g.65656  ORF Transcript_22136/g.65656 Transcript_22136/m.65656 type:complete len:83 (+) Transcript_22136:356-604(+)
MPGPLCHNGPFALSASLLISGNHTIIFVKFRPNEVLNAVTRHRPDFLYLCPTMTIRILKLPEEVRASADMPSIRMLLHSASY